MNVFRPFAYFAIAAFMFLTPHNAPAAQEPVFQGTLLSVWLEKLHWPQSEQQYAQASNAIHQIGTNAVPFVLQLVKTTNRPPESLPRAIPTIRHPTPIATDPLSLRAALACRILGSRAAPIITELTNQLSHGDWNEAKQAAQILLNCGALALFPLMKFYSSAERWSSVRVMGFFSSGLEGIMIANPKEVIPEMIRIYERGDPKMREVSREFLETAFSYELHKQNFDLLFPMLKSNLQSPESFIRSQILGYLRRCGPDCKAAVPEVKKLLSDSDPTVRSEATNAPAAIELQE